MDGLAFRLAGPDDLPFVRGHWLSSFRTAHGAGLVPMWLYFDTYHQVLDELLVTRPGEVIVAFKPGEPVGSDLYGFIAYERDYDHPELRREVDIVHYLYVAQVYRRMGIGRALFAEAGLRPGGVYTGLTAPGQRFARHYPGLRYDPLAARFGREPHQPKPSPMEPK